jgi:hypothetical protein
MLPPPLTVPGDAVSEAATTVSASLAQLLETGPLLFESPL